ncbi:MAG: hypothetical protein LBL09_02425 [Oscillospiraceae bacterium]|nr:hypothetical protein [Oscillospiraceae bacterium]
MSKREASQQNDIGPVQTEGSQLAPPLPEIPPAGQIFPIPPDNITVEDIRKAAVTLQRYKNGKANLESRIIEDEEWYKLNHWGVIRRQNQSKNPGENRPEPTSAWLFNSILNKHADAMDNYPEPNVLPRERSDEPDAEALSSILPVIMEHNRFEQTYSDNWWEKLKHGTAAYGVFWNNELDGGMGDIDITAIDLLNIFWQPGITDIQKSRNLFIIDLKDKDIVEAEYPHLKDKLAANAYEVKQYIHDDAIDTSDKVVIVDWYYKVKTPSGRTLLHYVKFTGEHLLFASENMPEYAGIGWYDHGMYPVIFDNLFPEKGSPVGFGYVAITKDPQLYIDKLGQNILENAMMATKPRYFAGQNTGVNEEEFLDWSKPIVHVEGSINEERLRPIGVTPLDGVYVNVLQMKINELKETSANRDFSQGGTSSGVTAAAAIAALQESGSKSSRDMISAAYRSYTQINYLCIELIRQFYDEARAFRIVGGGVGAYGFIDYSNKNLRGILPQEAQDLLISDSPVSSRRPIFDISIRAQKRNPYSRMSQNELAKQLYSMGFFDPARAEQSLCALELMEFEGKESVVGQISRGQTLLAANGELKEQLDKLSAAVKQLLSRVSGAGMPPIAGPNREGNAKPEAGRVPPDEKPAAKSIPDENPDEM